MVLWTKFLQVLIPFISINAATCAWDTAAIDNFFNGVLACKDVSALTLAIVQLDDNDNIVQHYTKGYGYKDPLCMKAGCPQADERTKFCIGSCTKAFTGSIVGTVLQNNNISKLWDTPLVKLLPPSQTAFFGGDPISTKVTVRDILSHRMGIERNDFGWIADTNQPRDQILSEAYNLNAIGPLEQVWRSSFHYNNWMVSLAAYIAETLSKDSWENLVYNYYYKPLGMTDSEFYHVDYETGTNYARMGTKVLTGNWSADPRPPGFTDYMTDNAPAGSICTTANDMAKYLQFLLKQNTSKNDMIPRNILVDAMSPSNPSCCPTTVASEPASIGFIQDTYGFGWWQGMYREYAHVMHGGDLFGHHANVMLLPTIKTGIFIGESTDIFNPQVVASAMTFFVADTVLGLPPYITLEKICSDGDASANAAVPAVPIFPPGNCTLDAVTARFAEKYAGIYNHPMFGEAVVSWEAETNQLTIAYGVYGKGYLCTWPEMYDNPQTFAIQLTTYLKYVFNSVPDPGFSVEFVLDDKGEAASLLFYAIETQGTPKFLKSTSAGVAKTGRKKPHAFVSEQGKVYRFT